MGSSLGSFSGHGPAAGAFCPLSLLTPISCRVTLAKILQRELPGEAQGRWRYQRAVSARRKSCEAKWPRVTLCEVVRALRKRARVVPMILPPAAWEQRAATLGEPAVFSLLLKADYLQTPWLTHCPSSASATVSSKVNPGLWEWLCVSPPQGKPASSFSVAAPGSAAGSSRWGCVGKALRTTPGNNYRTSWYWEMIILDTLINCAQAPLEKKRLICSGTTTVFGPVPYFLFAWGRKGDRNSSRFH